MKQHILQPLAAAALLALALAGPVHAQQGVSKSEIVIGSIQDLSGPIAGFGKQVRLGMMLRVDEINEQGGINGRKLKLIVEDSAFDPKKAVLAAQKWSTRTRSSSWPATSARRRTTPPSRCRPRRTSSTSCR